MYKIDKAQLKPILTEELGYSTSQAEWFLDTFPLIHEKLQPAIEMWLVNRGIMDLDVQGLSIKKVMEKRMINFLVAIIELNDLLDKNIPLEKRTKKREILSTQVYIE